MGGIIKSQRVAVDKSSVPKFNQGKVMDESKNDFHDSYGIIKSQAKAADSSVPKMNQGYQVDMGQDDVHDSYGIIKSGAKPVDNSVPAMNKGPGTTVEANNFDSYGIVKVPQSKVGPPP